MDNRNQIDIGEVEAMWASWTEAERRGLVLFLDLRTRGMSEEDALEVAMHYLDDCDD